MKMTDNSSEMSSAVPFAVYFDLLSGLSTKQKPTQRKLSAMQGMFRDESAYQLILSKNDPLIYEFYELGLPEHPGDLAFGTSITYPGRIGKEYYMTKGHFHTILETAEVYYCLKGHGYMMMENPEGDWHAEELTPGKVVYVPKRYAHRSVNTGYEPFITFFVFRADAGHNYGTIETKGFRKLMVEEDGKPVIVDNLSWKNGD
jgi:glucose-6-phosphate isomerase, archaeal